MKLYTVTVSSDIVVIANSPEEAERIAETDVDYFDMQLTAAASAYFLPYGWDEDSIPFGKQDDDKTISEWKEEMKQAQLEAEFAAKQVPLFLTD